MLTESKARIVFRNVMDLRVPAHCQNISKQQRFRMVTHDLRRYRVGEAAGTNVFDSFENEQRTAQLCNYGF
jgi:hypothetical protein